MLSANELASMSQEALEAALEDLIEERAYAVSPADYRSLTEQIQDIRFELQSRE